MSDPGDNQPERDGLRAAFAAALRSERDLAGLSASALARRAGLAKSTLSQLEAGQGNPGIETLWALANALAIPVGRLLEAPRPEIEVIRAGTGEGLRSGHADYVARLLSTAPAAGRRDIYMIEAEPGEPHRSAPHASGAREHVVLLAGRALVGPRGSEAELSAGDYIAYPADVAHAFEALAPGTRAVMVIEHR
ncbi:helix-turn-helix domain-containing protein [Stappia sp. MMSF_3263]|uniref:helix-turn-helix domain-containing protein n=1 Tax=Stappia sp. MMSF_3263 TaxID=3046693 RepID=UPI00273EC39D|nr:helix-turn-helix domain-containing protein [Stappia sp. MMSF_3263]